jgi:HEAT repeat protein
LNNNNTVRISRILDKLSRVQELGLACFGSNSHQFKLNPPITEAELREFEATHSVTLPDDFRAFLQQVGNGGAGPYYGIYPLDRWDDFATSVMDEVPGGFLAQPCPLKPGTNAGLTFENDVDAKEIYQGTLSLGTQGCSYAMQLIVTGSYRGRVVYCDSDGEASPYVLREPDFLSWYERWLDEVLGGYENEASWFGYGPGGGEEEFFKILATPDFDDELKAEAAWAFNRLPKLCERSVPKIVLLLTHAIPGVRSGASRAVEKFSIVAGIEPVALLIDNPDPKVRAQSVCTLMTLAPQRFAEAVRMQMHKESDSETASKIFFALQRASVLEKTDLSKILEGSEISNLRYLAASAWEWNLEDRVLAIRLLNDANPQARITTIQGLGKSELAATLILDVITRLEQEEDISVIDNLLKLLGTLADPAASDALLQWVGSDDDFHRLDAIRALIAIGDLRALEVVKRMLAEDRPPYRRLPYSHTTNIHTIRVLVQKMLCESPHPPFQNLAQ